LFVRVPDLHVDGLVHVTALPRDYYHRDPTGTELRGERTGSKYRLTDKLRVRLAAVNVEERKIDFVPVDEDSRGGRGSQQPRGSPAPPAGKKGGARAGANARGSSNADGNGDRARESRRARRKRGRG
jgi:ribonuclease R